MLTFSTFSSVEYSGWVNSNNSGIKNKAFFEWNSDNSKEWKEAYGDGESGIFYAW